MKEEDYDSGQAGGTEDRPHGAQNRPHDAAEGLNGAQGRSNDAAEGLNGAQGRPYDAEEEPLFAGSCTPRLSPPHISLPSGKQLLKTHADLPDDQFELLCIAAAEGDMDELSLQEFENYLSGDRERAATCSLYSRIRLKPADLRLPSKRGLKRRRAGGIIIRIAAAGLTAAASLALLIFAYQYFRGPASDTVPPLTTVTETAAAASPLTEATEAGTAASPLISAAETAVSAATDRAAETGTEAGEGPGHVSRSPSGEPPAAVRNSTSLSAEAGRPETELSGESVRLALPDMSPIPLSPAMIRIADALPSSGLATATRAYYPLPPEMLTIKDRLVLAFRERILGKSVPDISPIKSWEIAAAGVSGINRLLEWNMVLEVSGEEYGDAASVGFSSRLLKFQLPVKNISNEQ